MALNEEIINMLKCCLYDDEHIVKEPVLLKCGGNACKLCIQGVVKNEVSCYFCGQIHSYDDLKNLHLNPQVSTLIEKTFLNDLISILNNKFEETMKKFDGNY